MTIMTGLFRLGNNVEVRHTASGEPVASLSLAFDYGKKDDSGKRPTEWVSASLWGKRAESLTPHLTKGKLLYVVLEEPHIETYEGKNGTGSKMVARILNLEFAGSKSDGDGAGQQARQQAPRQPAAKPQPAAAHSGSGFGDFDSEVPFRQLGAGPAWRVI